MKLILQYMKKYRLSITRTMVVKFLAAITELLIPYVLEFMIDDVVPMNSIWLVIACGAAMILLALLTRFLNIKANRAAVNNAHNISYDVRQALFKKTIELSGDQFDSVGLPSLTSRLTSDSYNVQSFCQVSQTMMLRAPIMLLGGVVITLIMDPPLASILCALIPIMIVISIGVSRRGIPLYRKVQDKLDTVVRVMRENITGIRVVKALTKENYEKDRFARANDEMASSDIHASTVMAMPGPFMQICLNTGLALVVIFGARRVDSGAIKPGVILAFLTYFNMIAMGVMGLNRIFMMLSKSSASANRIAAVISMEDKPDILSEAEVGKPSDDSFICFDNVNFSYIKDSDYDRAGFGGEEREQCLYDISFRLKRGESLGIIGPTGCGKSTIIRLLLRFYDADTGGVYVDGRDVRTYKRDELHKKFGVVFQNDMIFFDTLRNNIAFGRELSDDELVAAIKDAAAIDYLESLEDGLDHGADIGGANLSGGQKQRILIARALAGDPDILILDDSSSALDYKTDAALRKAIFENHSNSTTIMIAQRVSSIQNMTHILVMDNGRCIGYGSHAELLECCPAYREIYETQMGALS